MDSRGREAAHNLGADLLNHVPAHHSAAILAGIVVRFWAFASSPRAAILNDLFCSARPHDLADRDPSVTL